MFITAFPKALTGPYLDSVNIISLGLSNIILTLSARLYLGLPSSFFLWFPN
jgi:hypothetical protein